MKTAADRLETVWENNRFKISAVLEIISVKVIQRGREYKVLHAGVAKRAPVDPLQTFSKIEVRQFRAVEESEVTDGGDGAGN